MFYYYLSIYVVFGLLIGSFLNVCIYRIPQQISIVYGNSYCPQCKQRIKLYDLIPVLSWILLGGKCRHCHHKISIHYPAIELLTSLLFALSYVILGVGMYSILTCLFFAVLVVASFIDLDTLEVPNRLVITIFGLGLIHLFITTEPISNYLIGLFAGSTPLLLLALLSKGGMGGGDIKLVAAAGLLMGWLPILLAIFFASIIALSVAIPALAKKKTGTQQLIPFVPFLALGMIVAHLWGFDILSWYLGMF